MNGSNNKKYAPIGISYDESIEESLSRIRLFYYHIFFVLYLFSANIILIDFLQGDMDDGYDRIGYYHSDKATQKKVSSAYLVHSALIIRSSLRYHLGGERDPILLE